MINALELPRLLDGAHILRLLDDANDASIAIVAAASDGFTVSEWAIATTWLTAAYILSRGIAKASRVLEQ